MGDPLLLPRVPRVRGAVARSATWWGRAFVRSFEETILDGAELPPARTLARSGRLGAIVVMPGMASAIVDDGPGLPAATPQLRVTRLTEQAWAGFEGELLRESGHLAALEAGRLPTELVEACDELGIEVVPGAEDLETACECDHWSQPCAHALALQYQLAWAVDRDPYVLLLLRGRTREQLLAAAVADATGDDPVDEAADRAAELLALAEAAPSGHGLADGDVAAYDEQVSRLLGD